MNIPCFFVLFFMAGSAMGQVAPMQARPAPTPAASPTTQAGDAAKKARIEGLVVSITGEPIPRAQIRLQAPVSVQNGNSVPGGSYGATADAAGKFAIEDIEPARSLQLTAQRPGFINARYGARSANGPAAPISLEPGQSLKGLTLTMTPQGVVNGRVTDASGDPRAERHGGVDAARLSTWSAPTDAGEHRQHDDLGEYRIANLAPGRYYLVVTDRRLLDIATSSPAAQNASVATFFPNGADLQGAAPIDVIAGQELRGIDVRMRQGRTFTVRGKVMDANGAGLGGVVVLSSPKNDLGPATNLGQVMRSQAQSRPDGSFELRGLPQGLHTLQGVPAQSGAIRTSRGRM